MLGIMLLLLYIATAPQRSSSILPQICIQAPMARRQPMAMHILQLCMWTAALIHLGDLYAGCVVPTHFREVLRWPRQLLIWHRLARSACGWRSNNHGKESERCGQMVRCSTWHARAASSSGRLSVSTVLHDINARCRAPARPGRQQGHGDAFETTSSSINPCQYVTDAESVHVFFFFPRTDGRGKQKTCKREHIARKLRTTFSNLFSSASLLCLSIFSISLANSASSTS